jgi:hypothetical protein
MHFLIYKITNRLNNKIYVGAHKTNDKGDGYFGSGLLIERSVSKHGKENFFKEILFELSTEEEMWQRERDIVDETFISRDDTYNIKLGGYGGFDYINKTGKNIYKNHSEIARKNSVKNFVSSDETKRRLILEGKWGEYKKKLSNSIKESYKKRGKSHWLGRLHREESKFKIGEKSKIHQSGKRNSQYGTKIIYEISTGNKMRLKSGQEIPIGWASSEDWKKITQEKTKSLKKQHNKEKSRNYAIRLHEEYINSGCRSLREFCKSDKYNHSVQALTMFWKKNIPDIYNPIHGKSY